MDPQAKKPQNNRPDNKLMYHTLPSYMLQLKLFMSQWFSAISSHLPFPLHLSTSLSPPIHLNGITNIAASVITDTTSVGRPGHPSPSNLLRHDRGVGGLCRSKLTFHKSKSDNSGNNVLCVLHYADFDVTVDRRFTSAGHALIKMFW